MEHLLPKSLYDDSSRQRFLDDLGTENPSPYQRFKYFIKLWDSWICNAICVESDQKMTTVLHQISKWGIKHSWDYQIRYSNKPGAVREVRFREPEYAMMIKLIISGDKK